MKPSQTKIETILKLVEKNISQEQKAFIDQSKKQGELLRAIYPMQINKLKAMGVNLKMAFEHDKRINNKIKQIQEKQKPKPVKRKKPGNKRNQADAFGAFAEPSAVRLAPVLLGKIESAVKINNEKLTAQSLNYVTSYRLDLFVNRALTATIDKHQTPFNRPDCLNFQTSDTFIFELPISGLSTTYTAKVRIEYKGIAGASTTQPGFSAFQNNASVQFKSKIRVFNSLNNNLTTSEKILFSIQSQNSRNEAGLYGDTEIIHSVDGWAISPLPGETFFIELTLTETVYAEGFHASAWFDCAEGPYHILVRTIDVTGYV